MKRLARPTKRIKKFIDIVVNIDDYRVDDPIAANELANTFQPSIKKAKRLSNEALSLYTNFLNSVLRVISNSGLSITDHYQSKKAYTYYIEAEHNGYIDDVYVKYEIQFRINDHINPTLNKAPKSDGSGQLIVPVLKDIRIGSYSSSVYARIMIYLNTVCKGILQDDENVLQTDMTIFNERE